MKILAASAVALATAVAPVVASARDDHQRPRHMQHQAKNLGQHRGSDGKGYYHGYRGYRGSRDHRAGYRRGHDGLWYPAAAFAIGAAIGGALSQ